MFLSSILGLSQSFCNDEIFVKLNLPVLPLVAIMWNKSKRYFDLRIPN